jgi:hypothetical protein
METPSSYNFDTLGTVDTFVVIKFTHDQSSRQESVESPITVVSCYTGPW